MGVSKNRGTPKWMVKIMENPIKMDDLGGKTPYFWKHPYMSGGWESDFYQVWWQGLLLSGHIGHPEPRCPTNNPQGFFNGDPVF